MRNKRLIAKPLELTLDTNIQFLIKKELDKALETFEATGGASLLMNVENGEILSLVSLPDFNINTRANIDDKKYQHLHAEYLTQFQKPTALHP